LFILGGAKAGESRKAVKYIAYEGRWLSASIPQGTGGDWPAACCPHAQLWRFACICSITVYFISIL